MSPKNLSSKSSWLSPESLASDGVAAFDSDPSPCGFPLAIGRPLAQRQSGQQNRGEATTARFPSEIITAKTTDANPGALTGRGHSLGQMGSSFPRSASASAPAFGPQ